MAVAIDQSDTTDATSNSVTSQTLTTLTVGSGTNRALVVALTIQPTATSASVHWDSAGTNQAMTLIGSQTVSDNSAKIYLYGLVAPTSGNKTLNATWTGTSDVTLAAICFTGVDQTGGTTSFAHFNGIGGSSGSGSQTVTSATGNWSVGVWAGNGTISTLSTTQWYLDNNPNNFSSAASQTTGAATVTFTASTPNPYAFAGCDIVAGGGGVVFDATKPFFMFMG